MSIQLIGLMTAAMAALGLLHSQRMALTVLCVAALLKAAAALFLGGANVPPGHLALAFFALAVIIRFNGFRASLSALEFPKAGFFLLLLVIWAVVSGFVMPRLFLGQFTVFPLTTTGKVIAEVPLVPVGSNMNQSIYFVGSLIAFITVVGMARTGQLLYACAGALIFAAGANVALAFLDAGTYAIGMADALSFLRNNNYAQLYTHEFIGIKRFVGSFPEASAFAGTSVGLFAFCFRLWRGGVMTFWTGWVSVGLLVCIMMALSSTGYVALAAYLMIAYSNSLTGTDPTIGRDRRTQSRRMYFISMGPAAALLGAMAVAFKPDLLDPIIQIFDNSITSKLGSSSGIERMSWNTSGIANFFQTFGLGAGIGSVRTSNFLIAIAANLGVIGLLLYGLFFAKVFTTSVSHPMLEKGDPLLQIAAAGRSGAFTLILSAMLSAPIVDLGILFFVMCGLACASVFETGRFGQPIIMQQPLDDTDMGDVPASLTPVPRPPYSPPPGRHL